MHLKKLKVGKPAKTFANRYLSGFLKQLDFPLGGVFCTEQPIPEVKLHLKKNHRN